MLDSPRILEAFRLDRLASCVIVETSCGGSCRMPIIRSYSYSSIPYCMGDLDIVW